MPELAQNISIEIAESSYSLSIINSLLNNDQFKTIKISVGWFFFLLLLFFPEKKNVQLIILNQLLFSISPLKTFSVPKK